MTSLNDIMQYKGIHCAYCSLLLAMEEGKVPPGDELSSLSSHVVSIAQNHMSDIQCPGQNYAERMFALKPDRRAIWNGFCQYQLPCLKRVLFFDYAWDDLSVVREVMAMSPTVSHAARTFVMKEVDARAAWMQECRRAWLAAVVM